MKWNFLVDLISVGILFNVSLGYSESLSEGAANPTSEEGDSASSDPALIVKQACSSCPYLNQCEVIICGSVYVAGHMRPEFVSGCSLDCPLGLIECKLGKDEKLAWHPVDPCRVETTTTTTTTTTITTTTSTVLLPNTPENPNQPHNDTRTKNQSITDDTFSNVTVVTRSTDFKNDTINSDATGSPVNTTLDSWGETSSQPFNRWILIWLIPVLVAIAVVIFLIVCCLAVNHYKHTRDKVYLNRRKQDGHYDQLVMNTIGSTVNGHRTNNSSYLIGTLIKTSNKVESNGSDKHVFSNGMFSAKRDRQTKSKKRSKGLKRISRKPSKFQSGTERKIINWQDVETHEFITPPSPRSATGHRSNGRSAATVTFGNKRASSSLSQCSTAFKAPASVHPLRRSPSPLSSHFGEVQSGAQSSVYDSQPISCYQAVYDDSHLMEGNMPIAGPIAIRETFGYYPTEKESDKIGHDAWFSQSTHELPSNPDERMSSLPGPYNFTQFRTPLHASSAFSLKELPSYQPSNSSIQSNIGDASPRIPRI